jgi:hypothetical protein
VLRSTSNEMAELKAEIDRVKTKVGLVC